MSSSILITLHAAGLGGVLAADGGSGPMHLPRFRGRGAVETPAVADGFDAAPRRLETRHASAHLRYSMPISAPTSWYNQVTPTDTAEATFFSTNSHDFGYMGLQQAGPSGPWREGRAIFAILDQGCAGLMDEGQCAEDRRAVVLTCGELARCERFGGQGTGVQSILRFDEWEVGRSYGFMVTAEDVGDERVEYAGYVHAEELGGWRLLSKVLVSTGLKAWYISSPASFLEQWKAVAMRDERAGFFGPSFVQSPVDSNWTQLCTASFSSKAIADEDPSRVNAQVDASGRLWDIGLGGDHVRMWYSTTLSVGQSAVPEALQSFAALRSAGHLPGGCEGGTCLSMGISGFFSDVFRTKRYSPITIAVILFVICCLCPGIAYYLVPRYRHRIRRLRHRRGKAVPPMEAGIAVVHEVIDRSKEAVQRVASPCKSHIGDGQGSAPCVGAHAAAAELKASARSLSASVDGRFAHAPLPAEGARQGERQQRGRSPMRSLASLRSTTPRPRSR
mmetsp:Transcript_36983/g.73591  ORF Transcript_36983/g.73591 Transcript_36983/m.73591 type:complete len:504 (+) Transcript_36983:59-1570(+)